MGDYMHRAVMVQAANDKVALVDEHYTSKRCSKCNESGSQCK